jgi:hypothetical protein
VGGDDHDRQRRGHRVGAKLAADLVAVHARQIEIEQHQLRGVLANRAHAGLAVSQADRAIALALEDAHQQCALRQLVFDDQHERRLLAGGRDLDRRVPEVAVVREVALVAREVHSPLPC